MVTFDLGAEFGKDAVEPERRCFGAGAGVAENERGAIFGNESGEFFDEAFAGVAGRWVWIFAERRINSQVDFLGGADVENFARAIRADEEARDLVGGRDGGGEADPLEGV